MRTYVVVVAVLPFQWSFSRHSLITHYLCTLLLLSIVHCMERWCVVGRCHLNTLLLCCPLVVASVVFVVCAADSLSYVVVGGFIVLSFSWNFAAAVSYDILLASRTLNSNHAHVFFSYQNFQNISYMLKCNYSGLYIIICLFKYCGFFFIFHSYFVLFIHYIVACPFKIKTVFFFSFIIFISLWF